jgi:hypothetical protein
MRLKFKELKSLVEMEVEAFGIFGKEEDLASFPLRHGEKDHVRWPSVPHCASSQHRHLLQALEVQPIQYA